MREAIRRALVVDNNFSRGDGIREVLTGLDIEAMHLTEVDVHDVAKGVGAENLRMHTYLDGIDLLFIHLAYPEALRKHHPGGNRGSLECLLAYRELLDDVCVVAYTGGSEPPPAEFEGVRRAGWHVHLTEVLAPSVLGIHVMLGVWRRRPEGPPPLSLLKAPALAPDYAVLLSAYQGGCRLPTVADWWNLLGATQNCERLQNELAQASDAWRALRDLVQPLHDWVRQRDGASLEEARLDAALHGAIIAVNPYPPAAGAA